MSIRVFDADAVRSALPMARCIDLMDQVQRSISRGEITLPLRSHVPLNEGNGLLLMPGWLPAPAVFGAKLLSLFPNNPSRRQKPVIQGYVLLFDGSDGAPLALLEASSLTALRTAAASGAATRALANPDAAVLALLGYGVQAGSHLAAMRAVRPVREVRVWGPDIARATVFAAEHVADGLTVTAVSSVEQAVRGADLLCAVSAARTPILRGEWLTAGCHVNLVGAHTAATREADGNTLARARVFTEITEFALAEAGDILLAMEEGAISRDHIAGEIGAALDGTITGREDRDQITLYKSLGNTAQDLAAAHHVLERARSMGDHVV
ncbi:MAG: ornithine cyclodeaminase family protein [Pseudomonadales bacterium]